MEFLGCLCINIICLYERIWWKSYVVFKVLFKCFNKKFNEITHDELKTFFQSCNAIFRFGKTLSICKIIDFGFFVVLYSLYTWSSSICSVHAFLRYDLIVTLMTVAAPRAWQKTRTNDKLERSRTVSRSSSFFTRTSQLWNRLPQSIFPEEYDLQAFKTRVNRFLQQWIGLWSSVYIIWSFGQDRKPNKNILLL